MSKLPSIIVLILIFLYIIPLSSSAEEANKANNTSNLTEGMNNSTDNNTNNTDDRNFFDFNPFKDFDFGNLMWLDDTNATIEMSKNELIYLVFYSPWCGHCHDFFPEYINASKYAEEKKLNVKFAKIDVSQSHNISERLGIHGIPTVFLIHKNKTFLYDGERTKDGLLKFLDRKLNDDIYKIETLSQIKNYIEASRLVLLSTLKNKEQMLYQSFANYSKASMDIQFISCQTDECIKEYNQDIILFKKFDEKINKYSTDMGKIEDAKMDSVKKFVGIYGIEAGAPLNVTEINMIFEHRASMLFYFRNSSKPEQKQFDSAIKELGKEFRSRKIYTVVSDIQGDPLQQNVGSSFIIVPGDLPALLFYYMKEGEDKPEQSANLYSLRPASKEQLNKDFIRNYIDDIIKEKIKPDLFSEAPMDNYIIDKLKYVIGRNFDKDVIEEKNNVILTFIDGTVYNPDSERVLSIMRNLTQRYPTEESKIVFAYIDAARNQPRNVDLSKERPPLVLLYANAMSEKKVIKMNHENFTIITEEEVEDFLVEKANLKKKPKDVTQEKVQPPKKEDKKEEKKDEKKEEKKEEKKDEKKKDVKRETDL